MGPDRGEFSVAVFPLLKTSGRVAIGDVEFRSTDDVDGLSREQKRAVREIASMLFLRDNLRIRSASYGIVPYVDLTYSSFDSGYLAHIQAAVAYLYVYPHPTSGEPFLPFEHSSIAIFSPADVSKFNVETDHHVVRVGPQRRLAPDHRNQVRGYVGVLNFRHHFYVAPGSRLYSAIPQPVLNGSQDLAGDILRLGSSRQDYRSLLALVGKSATEISDRVFTAVKWFNGANHESVDEPTAIVNLAIAFECLLRLPEGDRKTDRLVDAISLLLGRVPRLDAWARQFYDARSQVVHEGRATRVRFVPGSPQKGKEPSQYQPLVVYGREVFQLCLAALLVGAQLAERAGLGEKLVTNQERYESLCRIFADGTKGAETRLRLAEPLIVAINRFKFVPESNLRIDTMIGAARSAIQCYLGSKPGDGGDVTTAMTAFVAARRTDDHFEQLHELAALDGVLSAQQKRAGASPAPGSVEQLVDDIWGYVFMHYYWLAERRADGA